MEPFSDSGKFRGEFHFEVLILRGRTGTTDNKGLSLVVDTLSCECFADGSLIYCNYLINAQREKGIKITTSGKSDISVSAELIRP